MMHFQQAMKIALKEAALSLREGNHGFGAVLIRGDEVLAAAHDEECTKRDPTSHAEMNVLRAASLRHNGSLAGCALVCTHEPCPMCAAAIAWSGITQVAYGCSIAAALQMGRKRISIPCTELFERTGARVTVFPGILQSECELLYREDVRHEIMHLRGAGDAQLRALHEDSVCRRTKWFYENRDQFAFLCGDILDAGYQLLLHRLHITQDEAPVIKRTDREIIFHSMNFCPTLEACRLLGLDTRVVCKKMNEESTGALLKLLDPRLRFTRNYDCLRPFAPYCEECISIADEGEPSVVGHKV